MTTSTIKKSTALATVLAAAAFATPAGAAPIESMLPSDAGGSGQPARTIEGPPTVTVRGGWAPAARPSLRARACCRPRWRPAPLRRRRPRAPTSGELLALPGTPRA